MIRKKNNIILFIFSGILLLISSCNDDVLFSDSVSMEENSWSLFNNPEFKVQINDTLSSNNIYFTIRTGSQYPFRNIFLFVTTTSPKGISVTDTLNFFLADEKGKWYGKGFGDIHELDLPYRKNIYFPSRGTYQIKVQHGMRAGDLKGVYDLGLRVEKISR